MDDYQSLSQGGSSTHDLDGSYGYSDTNISLTDYNLADSGYAGDVGSWGEDSWVIQDSPLTVVESGEDGSNSSATFGDQPTTSESGTYPDSQPPVPSGVGVGYPMSDDAAGALSEIEAADGFAGLSAGLINPADYVPPYVGPIGLQPDTSNMTRSGQPMQALGGLGSRLNDDVSRGAPPDPTATLIALAAAGRDPTDITLPTVGSQAVDPPPGSHEEPGFFSGYAYYFNQMYTAPVTAAATKADQVGGAALSYVLTGSARTGDSGSAVGIIIAGDKGVLQGGANTVNGVQDGLIGTGNLGVKLVNAAAGYTVTPERASPDWSRDLFVAESDAVHNTSKFLGGTGASYLIGGGLGGAARVGTAGAGAGGAQSFSIIAQGGAAALATDTPAAVVIATPAAVGATAGGGVGLIGQTVQMSTGGPGSAPNAELQAARQTLGEQLAALLRRKAGFSDEGIPLIIDSNSERAGMAEALRARGYNVRTVTEIFGSDPGDPAITALAQQIGGKVLTFNMKDFGRNIAIKIDQRAASLDTWIRLIEEGLR